MKYACTTTKLHRNAPCYIINKTLGIIVGELDLYIMKNKVKFKNKIKVFTLWLCARLGTGNIDANKT